MYNIQQPLVTHASKRTRRQAISEPILPRMTVRENNMNASVETGLYLDFQDCGDQIIYMWYILSVMSLNIQFLELSYLTIMLKDVQQQRFHSSSLFIFGWDKRNVSNCIYVFQ
ncbi:Hypothetical_protein [Hexamita inflata]|uniref:Hypothetical_protein n=1 Tax=Hexamita inflata TaxID=28002 RepID=A0AA86NHK9_9EUKA|nr:Hypothetical protein HINF_LOCUS7752 [Hexamita inflata]